jgi:16S rRNA (uracil1498-N3)-methyltransferase
MKHRFFVPAALPIGETVEVAGEELHHAVRVVRVREGEEIEVFDGRGSAAAGRVETIDAQRLVIRLTGPADARESTVAIRLAMAVIHLDKFELVLQKATELGARSIIPLVTARVEVRPERYRGKRERWEKIILEAVKQCGRAVIPFLEEPAELADVVARDDPKIFFDADAEPNPAPASLGEVTLIIGPEGGWTDAEITLAREHGCWLERLGARRLRAETAAVAACAIVSRRYGAL